MELRFPGIKRIDPRGNVALWERICDEIRQSGPITFERFMELALYDPEHGYYVAGGRVGRRGDFLTSPHIHPAFGGVLARQLLVLWESIGRPDGFEIVEVGADDGTLAEQINVPFPYRRIEWGEELPSRLVGVVLSNELLDAFPVRRYRGGEEVCVSLDEDNNFLETPASGPRAERNPRARQWIADVASRLERGFVFSLDYGDAHPHDDTLRCFAQHGAHTDPYKYVGQQDITADVDFSSFADVPGLGSAAFLTQRELLRNWGLADIAAELGDAEFMSDLIIANREGLEMLMKPDGLGRIKAFVQAKGVEPVELPGLHGPATDPFTWETLPRIEVANPFAPILNT